MTDEDQKIENLAWALHLFDYPDTHYLGFKYLRHDDQKFYISEATRIAGLIRGRAEIIDISKAIEPTPDIS